MNSNLNNNTDNELVLLFKQQNSESAFGELYKRYYSIVVGVCIKYLKNIEDAKDMAMQVFEKSFNNLHKYEVENFGAWIYKVAKNECLMLLRKNGNKVVLTENIQNYVVENEEGLHQVMQKESNLNNMATALNDLPVEQKQCVELFYLQKKSYSEIQDLTGFSFMQVKSYIQNAKRNLKIKMSHIE